MGTGSFVAFGVGAAAIGAAALYFFWPGSKSDARASARVVPAASRDAGGLLISGSF
jgi:hypothetical protein